MRPYTVGVVPFIVSHPKALRRRRRQVCWEEFTVSDTTSSQSTLQSFPPAQGLPPLQQLALILHHTVAGYYWPFLTDRSRLSLTSVPFGPSGRVSPEAGPVSVTIRTHFTPPEILRVVH